MSDSKPIFGNLTDHPLIMTILDDYMPLMKAERKGVEYSALTTQQQYQYETGYRAGQILNQLERIEQASILVNSYPYIKAWREHYGQFEFFQYNMEAYFLGVAGLVDRLLILVNELCRLGLDSKDAKMTPVVKKLKAAGYSEVVTLLENLKAGTELVKKERNDMTHAHRYHEKELWHIAVLEFSLRNKTVDDADGYIKADLDWDIKYYRKKKKDQLQTSNNALIPMVKSLFDELATIYKTQRSQ
jgi:hypothetical protein